MKDISLQRIVDIISEAFNIFDFSFIVSGGATYIVLGIFLHSENLLLLPTTGFEIALFIVCSILAVYVLGLLSWIIGKSIRSWIIDFEQDRNETLLKLRECYKSIIDDIAPIKKINFHGFDTYTWTQLISQKPETVGLQNRLNFLYRLWIMQAVCEGLIGTDVVVIFIFGFKLFENFSSFFFYLFIVLIALFIGILCSNTARYYANTRIKTLYAAYITFMSKDEVFIDIDVDSHNNEVVDEKQHSERGSHY